MNPGIGHRFKGSQGDDNAFGSRPLWLRLCAIALCCAAGLRASTCLRRAALVRSAFSYMCVIPYKYMCPTVTARTHGIVKVWRQTKANDMLQCLPG